MQRDAIDFGKMSIGRLFFRLFIPTFLGLLFGALFNVADGIFVGRGVGSDALAAVNIAAPVYMFFTGLALMFGAGVSVVAAIHLSKNNDKAARICVTQALTVSVMLGAIMLLLIEVWPEQVSRLFGGSARLEPLVVDYLRYVAGGLLGCLVMLVGMFIIRLDGSPRYAMLTNIVPAVLNIFLDWLFVFPLQWGIKGAAFATSISEVLGMAMVLAYIFFRPNRLRLYRPKFSPTALRLTLRNVGYMARMGLPTLLGELALTCMMVVGNYAFIMHLGEDGVAAFSVACYLMPLVFMFGNGIAQSLLPIVSYNHGLGDEGRIRATLRVAMATAVGCGVGISLLVAIMSHVVAGLFLGDATVPLQLCEQGLPLFAAGFLFMTINLVLIGYEQSLEHARAATAFMLLRGFVLIIACFLLLPALMGTDGLWLAMPASELITLLIIFLKRQ